MTFYNRIEHPVYFNDFDESACAWIAELMKQGYIPPGEIDRRSILEVTPDDVKGFKQCHFFAGIGGWAYALRLVGVPVDISLWTGSPPCQPFSVAGRRKGRDDERHLAPQFADLIRACKPDLLFGEQVASAEVFGKAGNKDVHPLWRREELLRFLDDSIKWELAQRLSGVPEQGSQGTPFRASGDRASPSNSDAVEREVEGFETRSAVRFDSGILRSKTDQWCLRGDRYSILNDIEEGVGFAVDGPDCSVERIHSIECEDGSVLGEHGLLRLGRGTGEVCSTRDLEDAHSNVKRSLEETRRDIEASSGWTWIDALHADLEGSHYALGAVDFPSAGVGAPHIRQRTYFGAVAHEWLEHASRNGRIEWGSEPSQRGAGIGRGTRGLADLQNDRFARCPDREKHDGWVGSTSDSSFAVVGLADLHSDGCAETGRGQPEAGCDGPFGDSAACGLGDCLGSGLEGLGWNGDGSREPGRIVSGALGSASEAGTVGEGRPGPTNGFWGNADWLFCRDERFRPVEPGTFPLAPGVSGRVGLLRGYGNAINPQQASIFIQAFFEALENTVRAAACEQVPDLSLDGLIVR